MGRQFFQGIYRIVEQIANLHLTRHLVNDVRRVVRKADETISKVSLTRLHLNRLYYICRSKSENLSFRRSLPRIQSTAKLNENSKSVSASIFPNSITLSLIRTTRNAFVRFIDLRFHVNTKKKRQQLFERKLPRDHPPHRTLTSFVPLHQ